MITVVSSYIKSEYARAMNPEMSINLDPTVFRLGFSNEILADNIPDIDIRYRQHNILTQALSDCKIVVV